jgi:hypothetical protein
VIALVSQRVHVNPQPSTLPYSAPRAIAVLHTTTTLCTTATMDTDMMDAGYDIDIDVGAPVAAPAQEPQQVIEVNRAQG